LNSPTAARGSFALGTSRLSTIELDHPRRRGEGRLDCAQNAQMPVLAKIARRLAIDLRLGLLFECLNRELFGNRQSGASSINSTKAGRAVFLCQCLISKGDYNGNG
jgi:hypothetical protein